MGKVENSQMEFGEIAIDEIHIKVKSRDNIPAVFKGIQHMHTYPLRIPIKMNSCSKSSILTKNTLIPTI